VTKEVRALVTPEQSLEIKRDEFKSYFRDPWLGVVKSSQSFTPTANDHRS
jgi:hypothetical protein